jgi:hypothetical protein
MGGRHGSLQAAPTIEEDIMKRKTSKAPGNPVSRQQLNQLMEAMALVIARRQMKHYWAPVHRTGSNAMV